MAKRSTLYTEHGMFFGTYNLDKKSDAEKHAAAENLQILPFGVNISTTDPDTGQVLEWQVVEGWSVWGNKAPLSGNSYDDLP